MCRYKANQLSRITLGIEQHVFILIKQVQMQGIEIGCRVRVSENVKKGELAASINIIKF